ncbi:hypothetical protein MXB_1312 [Myxobolus squamalis]|nr:hypothetical protein MXB_1312 [Myxobolus squamalis]
MLEQYLFEEFSYHFVYYKDKCLELFLKGRISDLLSSPQFSLLKVYLFDVINKNLYYIQNLTLFCMNFFNPKRIDYFLKIQVKDVLSLFLNNHSIKRNAFY